MSWISLPRLFHSGCFLLRAKKKTFVVYVLPTTCFLSSLLCVISAEITLNPKRTQSFSFFRFLDHRNVHEHFHLKTLWLNQTFPQLITTTSVQFSVFVTLKGSWDLFVALMSLSDVWVMFWLVTSVHLNLYLHFLALLQLFTGKHENNGLIWILTHGTLSLSVPFVLVIQSTGVALAQLSVYFGSWSSNESETCLGFTKLSVTRYAVKDDSAVSHRWHSPGVLQDSNRAFVFFGRRFEVTRLSFLLDFPSSESDTTSGSDCTRI